MSKSVLFVGQAYYNHFYLSRELRKIGWKADLVDFDPNSRGFYHGYDRLLTGSTRRDFVRHSAYFARAARQYDVFHFANAWGMRLGDAIGGFVDHRLSPGADVRLLKRLGKKILYTNNGCSDGVAQSSFRAWQPYPTCDDCPFQHQPGVCSDELNLRWGALRNELADYVAILGGNRADYNVAPNVHECPWVYCLDADVWSPDLMVPANYQLPGSAVRIYHSVGNADRRSQAGTMRNTKSTHIYLPLVDQLRAEGHDCELIFFKDVPNYELRYYQAQADIFVDMLTTGFTGATAREGMMLGKPVVAYIRPEWMDQVRRELPEYADELPIVSATPDTVHDVLADLVSDRAKREEIGARSRAFALKWHAADVAAREFDRIYSSLLDGTLPPSPWAMNSSSPDSPARRNPVFS